MKKIIAVLLMVCMCSSLAACGSEQAGSSIGVESSADEMQASEVSKAAEESAEPVESIEEQTEVAASANTEATADTSAESASSTLVVYFSATGTTKGIAEYIAEGLSADIYEITPEEPYTDADLDYNDNNSRSTVEMDDPSVRPAIAGSIDNFEQYDTIYVGYPIWWGAAPRIMDTFAESYDFTDKTVIPFCTSGSSGVGSSASTLADLAGTGNWLDGTRFSGNETAEDIMEWVNGL